MVVLLIFGTKKLRNIGSDLGGAVKGFKDAMHEEQQQPPRLEDSSTGNTTVEGEVKEKSRQ